MKTMHNFSWYSIIFPHNEDYNLSSDYYMPNTVYPK